MQESIIKHKYTALRGLSLSIGMIVLAGFSLLLTTSNTLAGSGEKLANPAMDMPAVVTQSSTNAVADSPATKKVTHNPIRLSPDDTKLIRLNKDAGMVVVGNPEHANVVADSARTLIVIPRRPGATYFTVMDRTGDILMHRLVIIAGPEEQYIRVKNTCRGSNDKNCKSNSVYYCPDTCHEIFLSSEEPATMVEFNVSDSPSGNAGGGDGGNDMIDDEAEDEYVGDEPQ